MTTCECGCGGEITSKPRAGWTPRYIKGHNNVGVRRGPEDTRPERIFCKCGCGTELKRARYLSHQRRYVHNHHWRGVARSVTYDWAGLPADLERLGSTAAVADEVGVSQAEVWRKADEIGYSVTGFRSGGSRLGRLGEELALALLDGSEDMLHRGTEPYDLLWNGQRVNVKTATPNKNWGWSFNTGSGRDGCDAFFLVALDHAEDFVAAWLVPVEDCARGCRVGTNSNTKYARFRFA